MYKQYELPYNFDALEPFIDAVTMETHYLKHHATYTKNLNDAVQKAGLQKDIQDLLATLDSIEDTALRQAIRNNGGGYYNHNLYFSTISPTGSKKPQGDLAQQIESNFGSFSDLKDQLSKLALGQFGSGWAWLSADTEGKLTISSSPNQDNPISEQTGYFPILGIDVWEHAYYLKYKNLRADYISAFFNIIDWEAVEKNYHQIKK